MAIRRCLIAFAVLASAASAAAQDKDKLGELQFSSCQGCHIVGEVGDNKKWKKSGPHLNELFGRKPGSLPGYTYSPAMAEFGKDHVWDEATLMAFLHDPPGVVPGNTMKNFTGGLKSDEQLRALLAYLATFDKDGMAPN